jgi:thymidine phosphorylase
MSAVPVLRARRMGIDTYQERVAYMRSDCEVWTSEGFAARARIELRCGEKCVVVTLNVVHFSLLGGDEIGLSEAAWSALGEAEGVAVQLFHPAPLQSFSAVRGKIFGRPLSNEAAIAIVDDVCAGRYSEIEMAALVTACSGGRMDVVETIALTRAMIDAGQRLNWDSTIVVDKHCVGGLPGNRTTLLVVPIVAACGLRIPKTSSRAITSPAGSADAMETLAPVTLDVARMRAVVEREGGCIVWGGAVALSPADDLLIRVERPLGLDSDGLLVASILSKKIAAGSSHVLIDIPVGRTAKVRSPAAAADLALRLKTVGQALGLVVEVLVTDGAQPVGCGIGPALEARDILSVLQGRAEAPDDLRQRGLLLAGAVLEMGGKAKPGEGIVMARHVLDSGAAWIKFQAICQAQGGMREPPVARFTQVVSALHTGEIVAVDNRALAQLAKLAGAPRSAAAGISIHVRLGALVVSGQPLVTVHAESPGALAYAIAYAEAQEHLVTIQQLAR